MAKKIDIKDILDNFQLAHDFYEPEYQRGDEDGEFTLGNQWPEEAKKARKNRPMLTENRTLSFVNQVVNSVRQARPSIVVKPVDDNGDVKKAEIIKGLIHNIESISSADVAYETAAFNSVSRNLGWVRVITDYADYNSFDQDIKIERIINPRSVLLDPNHQNLDGSDAEYGFVYDDMPKDVFRRKYPDALCEGFETTGWVGDKTVRVADYYYKDYETKTLVEYEMVIAGAAMTSTGYKDGLPEGVRIIQEREVKICTVKYAKITGAEILEEGEFAGVYIPLVPIVGLEAYMNGKRSFWSLIHPAKDSQRMLNYWRSASTEIMALQPKTPYLGAVGQFDTRKKQWEAANTENFPYLEYDMVVDPTTGVPAPAPQRQQPPTGSPAMMQEAMNAIDAIKGTLGIFDASLGAISPDTSGKAIINRQMQGDNATFHFIDNLATAIQHVGRIIVGIIPTIYSTKRVLRIIGEDGQEKMVPINQPVQEVDGGYVASEAGGMFLNFDGKYDVTVDVGPSYASRRQETADKIMELLRIRPEFAEVAGDIFVKNLDFQDAETIAKRIQSMMDPKLLGEDIEAQRMAAMNEAMAALQEKLAMTEQALMAKQQNEEFKNSLEAKKVENDTRKLMIDAAEAEARIAKMAAETRGVNAADMQGLMAIIQDLSERVADTSGALDVLLASEEGAGEATGMPEMPEPIKE